MAHAKSPAHPDSLLVSLDEARALLGVGSASLQTLMRTGELPVVRYGRRGVRIRRADLEAYVERSAVPWSEGGGDV